MTLGENERARLSTGSVSPFFQALDLLDHFVVRLHGLVHQRPGGFDGRAQVVLIIDNIPAFIQESSAEGGDIRHYGGERGVK